MVQATREIAEAPIDHPGTLEELKVLVEIAEAELKAARKNLKDALIAAAPWKEGDVIKDRKGEEAKVLRISTSWSDHAWPVVVYRKKGGDWGTREYTLYSWDLPEEIA